MYRRTLLDVVEYYDRLASHYATLRASMAILMALLAYGALGYIISLFPETALSLRNLLLIFDIIKLVLYYFIAFLIAFPGLVAIHGGASVLAITAGFLTALTLVGFPTDLAEALTSSLVLLQLFSLESLVYSVVLLGFLIAGLLIFGFLRRGALENLILAYFLIFAGLLLAFIFSGPEVIEVRKISELKDVHEIIFDRSFILFLLLFAVFELGGIYSQLYTQLKYLGERLRRISNQILGVYQIKEEVGEKEKEYVSRESVLAEGTRLFEKLSPLAAAMLRDAYEGYAFLGEGTSLYMSSKLKSYVSFQMNKNPELLDSIAGAQLTVGLSLGSALLAVILKLLLTFGVIVLAALVSSYVLANIGYGMIVESTLPVAFVVGTYSVIFLVYLATKLMVRT